MRDPNRGGASHGDSHWAEAHAADTHAARIELRRRIGGGVLTLDIEDLLRLFPHRPPQLLLDRVVALVPGDHAVGIKQVSGDEAGLVARRTGFVFPSTFVVEALSQLGQLVASGLAIPEQGTGSTSWPELVEVPEMEVFRELEEPSTLQLVASRLESDPGSRERARVECTAEATADGEPVVRARLIFRCA